MSMTKRFSPTGIGTYRADEHDVYRAPRPDYPPGFEEGYEESFPHVEPADEDLEAMAREFEKCR